MATTDWQKGVAEEVILEFARQGAREWNEHLYESIVFSILRKKKALWESRWMHSRAVKSLIKRGFERKVAKAIKTLPKTPGPPVIEDGTSPFPRWFVEGAKDHAREIEGTLPEGDRE